MKKIKLPSVLVLLALLFGCSNEDINIQSDKTVDKVNAYGIKDIPGTTNPDAAMYYGLIKKVILATGSNQPETRAMNNPNPLVQKLEAMNIKNASNTSRSFYDLKTKEQERFLEEWAALEAKELSQKLALRPDLIQYIQKQNTIVQQILNEESVQTRSGETRVTNVNRFFEKINNRMQSSLQSDIKQTTTTDKREIITAKKGKALPAELVKGFMEEYARPGDFMLELPLHNDPGVYMNIGKTTGFVGHGSVITNQVTRNTKDDAVLALSAHEDGIVDELVNRWYVRCYIMGFQHVGYKWSWTEGMKKIVEPVDEPIKLANEAYKYKGRPYVRWYEFLFSKSAAPKRFTCVSLIWWCAKDAYGIDVSNWWDTLISPSSLFLSDYTYIRKEITQD